MVAHLFRPGARADAVRTEGGVPGFVGEGVDGDLRPHGSGPELKLRLVGDGAREQVAQRIVDGLAEIPQELLVSVGIVMKRKSSTHSRTAARQLASSTAFSAKEAIGAPKSPNSRFATRR